MRAKAPPVVIGSLKKSREAAALISEMFVFSTAFVVGLSRTNLQFCSGLSVQQEATGPFFQGGQLWPLSQMPPPSVNIPEHRAWDRLTGRPGRSRTLRCPPAVSCWRSGGSVQTCARGMYLHTCANIKKIQKTFKYENTECPHKGGSGETWDWSLHRREHHQVLDCDSYSQRCASQPFHAVPRNRVKLSRPHQSWQLRQAIWFAAACAWLDMGVAPRVSSVDTGPPQGPDSRGTPWH